MADQTNPSYRSLSLEDFLFARHRPILISTDQVSLNSTDSLYFNRAQVDSPPSYETPQRKPPRGIQASLAKFRKTFAFRKANADGSADGKVAATRDSARERFLRALEGTGLDGHVPLSTGSSSGNQSSANNNNNSSDGSKPLGFVRDMMTGPRRETLRSALAANRTSIYGGRSTPPLVEETKNAITSLTTAGLAPLDDEKPVASGNGLAAYIRLTEPILFLQGYDQHDPTASKTTMLRGSLVLRVTKSAKIKTISLKFKGRGITEWPEGIPPKKTEFRDVESLMNHTWTFFNFQFPNADSHCADQAHILKGPQTTTTEVTTGSGLQRSDSTGITPLQARRFSLQSNGSTRSLSKDDSCTVAGSKGYRVFTPGEYIYSFELPIDSRMPESVRVELGTVRYDLEAIIERSGAFRANLIGSKEVTLIRAPSENSLENVEPIAISRDWEDQLHYDIIISGKSFPLGSQVPIAFKLTPLAKIQLHRVRVYMTENIQYFTANKKVHRLEPTRKIQLFEKRADSRSTSAFPGSTIRITAGGGVAYDDRSAAAEGREDVERDRSNLLGNLDGEHNVGPTEMEFNVQLPSCYDIERKEKGARVMFDTTYTNIQVNHWIKIVMRLSKPDPENSNKRRHFEISIDSPFNILSCRATQANISLPAYADPHNIAPLATEGPVCGCPGAPKRRRSSPTSYDISLAAQQAQQALASQQQQPASTSRSSSPSDPDTPPASSNDVSTANLPQPHIITRPTRPIHLLRAPSFNPPAFDDDQPPPPLITPPPKYETLVNGDPREGLADYFARLAEAVGDDDTDDEENLHSPRIDLPLTPGGRVNRSMDELRTWLPMGGRQTSGTGVQAA